MQQAVGTEPQESNGTLVIDTYLGTQQHIATNGTASADGPASMHSNNANNNAATESDVDCHSTSTNCDSEQIDSDKKAIYKHPLFPLMALVFDRCEKASNKVDNASLDSFEVDIQAFVHSQEREQRPFFSEDSELDNLMVKAIQVLRIHLLELEKVNDLCKDFCQRYITCLKGKLQSDNLLNIDMNDLDSEDSETVSSNTSSNNYNTTNENNNSNGMLCTNNAGLAPGQVVSGGTVYQMVQTPQGLVAQPIQIQTPDPNVSSNSVVHGTTTLGAIGTATDDSSSNASVSAISMVDDDFGPKRNSKRGILPKSATKVMKSWLFQHIIHPYPTEDEKKDIAMQTNLSLLQVNNWFINARRRILQPMLDATNPDAANSKAQAKSKPKTPHKPQRAWLNWPENMAKGQVNYNNNQSGDSSSDKSEQSTVTTSSATSTANIINIAPKTKPDSQSVATEMAASNLISLSNVVTPITLTALPVNGGVTLLQSSPVITDGKYTPVTIQNQPEQPADT